MRVRHGSNIMPSAAAAAAAASKTLLVGIAAASGLRVATAFGFGSALSPATAVMASTAGGEPSRASGVSRRQGTTMTEKPSRVFVAGATGRLGQRVVRELLLDGVGVTAAVRPSSLDKANSLFSDKDFMSEDLLGKLDVVGVEPDSEKEWRRAMQSSQAVVCALGASESEPFNVKGPSQVDGKLSQRVVLAAKETASVRHFVLVTALGTGKFGWPASALNLFWGILSWKRKTEKALIDSGLPYTILRPGGMEKPQDDFEETHNVRVASKDTLFGGVVSRLQV
ncbi:unnamed protein product, partial [Laminaria digitata]